MGLFTSREPTTEAPPPKPELTNKVRLKVTFPSSTFSADVYESAYRDIVEKWKRGPSLCIYTILDEKVGSEFNLDLTKALTISKEQL